MLKRWLKLFVIHLGALWVTATIVSGLHIPQDRDVWVLTALTLTFLRLFVHPLLKLMLLPINLITSLVASFLIHIITLYILLGLIPQITISPSVTPPFEMFSFIIPSVHLTSFLTAVLAALILSLASRFFTWFLS